MQIADIKIGSEIVIATFLAAGSEKLKRIYSGTVTRIDEDGLIIIQGGVRKKATQLFDLRSGSFRGYTHFSGRRFTNLLVLSRNEELTWDRPDFVNAGKQRQDAFKIFVK